LKTFITLIFMGLVGHAISQTGSFSAQVGSPGSDAISKDSSAFRDWAISCDVTRGLKQIDLPDSGIVSAGMAVYATGKADAPLVVSLGDGGEAFLQFSAPFHDGNGPDFAVFENGFGSGVDAFLELAFVSVSSDGINYFEFSSISEQQAQTQVGTFENTDASLFHNLAGKHVANFGTPFDLAEIADTNLLDKQNVTHIKITDVVGVIDTAYAGYDSEGSLINDPWPTNFDQGGFDLDAVGIIHSNIPVSIGQLRANQKNNEAKRCLDLIGREVPCSGSGIGWIIVETESGYAKRYVER
jgi:hypothetical protein